ncbi:uncharacterized protein LOC134531674 isoform X1 [Bacillus rossius redtenbacheri]|uniref:uncharacterized protein LOC134531674 isoform X1 n=1 Tax=Bacillus rossius redtenbacheri TaxID=93214 RepID=UPI002FDD8E0D
MKSGGGGGSGGPLPAPRVRKAALPRRRFTRRSVLKMMAVMEQSPDTSHDPVQDFLTSGRTGRRNALPDILGEHAATSTADLPVCIQQLSTADASSSGASTSSSTASDSPTTSSNTTPTEPTDSEMQDANTATTSS